MSGVEIRQLQLWKGRGAAIEGKRSGTPLHIGLAAFLLQEVVCIKKLQHTTLLRH